MSKMTKMPTRPTEVEKIALAVQPVWNYYCRQLCHLIPPKSIQDNIASGNAQLILDAFGHLSRSKACFLALVGDIISGQNPLKIEEVASQEESQPGSRPPGVGREVIPCPARKLCPVFWWLAEK